MTQAGHAPHDEKRWHAQHALPELRANRFGPTLLSPSGGFVVANDTCSMHVEIAHGFQLRSDQIRRIDRDLPRES